MTDFNRPQFVDCNGIRLATYAAGRGPLLLLLHGFPELAYSWRHQLPALANAGYRAVAVDLRGYGQSDKPPGVEAYTQAETLADLTGLLDALQEDTAIVIAHDWGALLAWQLALLHAERLRGLVALNIPFLPRPDRDPVALMREKLGKHFYVVNFQDSDEADRLFDANPRRFISRMMRRDVISRERFQQLPAEQRIVSLIATMSADEPRGEPLLADHELDYYATAFAAGGFSGPINWYRNWSRNWRDTEGVEQRVRVPTLFIGAEDDVVVTPAQIANMARYVDDLEQVVLPGCGHWTQQECPDETNRLLLDWLSRRFPVSG